MEPVCGGRPVAVTPFGPRPGGGKNDRAFDNCRVEATGYCTKATWFAAVRRIRGGCQAVNACFDRPRWLHSADRRGPCVPAATERWQSGRMHRTRNAAYGQPYRGFESLPLRQFPNPLIKPVETGLGISTSAANAPDPTPSTIPPPAAHRRTEPPCFSRASRVPAMEPNCPDSLTAPCNIRRTGMID
jgi:hypothetical protein